MDCALEPRRRHYADPLAQPARVSKRHRDRKTCEECRRQKTKCNITSKSQCSRCQEIDVPCSVNEHRRQRNQRNRTRIDHLEENLERMESCLHNLGFDIHPDNPIPNPTAVDPARVGGNPLFDVEGLLNECRPELSIPSFFFDAPYSRGISVFSPEGREWINEKLQGDSIEKIAPLLSSDTAKNKNNQWSIERTFPRQVFIALPPDAETASLVSEFAHGFNAFCPLFQTSTLNSIIDGKDQHDLQDPGQWACMNVILAFGSMLRATKSYSHQTDFQKSWLYMKNAMSVLNELFLCTPNIWSVQALLGMTLFFHGTLHNRPCHDLIHPALHLSHQLATDHDVADVCLEELEQRKRVYWIAYCIDKDISLRFGSPPAQSEEEPDVGFPLETLNESLASTPITSDDYSFDAFRSICELSIIKGNIYHDLYSTSATSKSPTDVVASVEALDSKLQDWKARIPARYQPDCQSMPGLPKSILTATLLFLHYAYYSSVITIHHVVVARDLIFCPGKTSGLDALSHPLIFGSDSQCLQAARASIRLIKYIPEENPLLTGILANFIITASTTLSSNLIKNPQLACRAWDMNLLLQAERYLHARAADAQNKSVDKLINHCTQYRVAAEQAIKRAECHGHS